MTEMLELPDTIFEAAMIIILQQAIMNVFKPIEKYKNSADYLSKEMKDIKKTK